MNYISKPPPSNEEVIYLIVIENITKQVAVNFGFSGIIKKGSITWVRKTDVYAGYYLIEDDFLFYKFPKTHFSIYKPEIKNKLLKLIKEL